MKLLLAFFIILIPSTSIAEPVAPEAIKSETRIEADNEAGQIKFFIKGELEAVLDENGLHIRDSVDFGATITDTGSAAFDAAHGPKAGADAP
jgi:hypothetical protein